MTTINVKFGEYRNQMIHDKQFKLLGSLWLFSALVAMIVVLTEWFLETFGVGTFVFTLIVTSFLLTVLTSATVRKPIATEEKKQDVLE
jgi:H+/Cl- antiporter ClcA